MKRAHVNGLIDALAFVAFLFLLSTGLVLLYQLPPGSGGRQGFGTGHGASERAIQLLWGLTRHEWGQIHYWIAYVLMAVLAAHLFLHWKWIVGVVRGRPTSASPYRLILGSVGLVSVILLTAIPMTSPTSTVRRSELQDRQLPEQNAKPQGFPEVGGDSNGADNHETGDVSQSIRGSMTLEEISAASGMPVTEIIATLGLPKDVDPKENAGRLLRQHGRQMADLRAVLNRSPHEPPNGSKE